MLKQLIHEKDIPIRSILHIGANYCQEQAEYLSMANNDSIHWIEAIPKIVADVKARDPSIHIYQALLTNRDNDTKMLHIANNTGLSSSVLEFGKHSETHPSIVYVDHIKLQTTTLDTFVMTVLSGVHPNVLVIDVQGAELMVLEGAANTLPHVDIILTEVNTDQTYLGNGLVSDIDTLLGRFGFKKIHQNIWSGHTYGDAIYVSERFL
jgi:FkbM family methyltransferase